MPLKCNKNVQKWFSKAFLSAITILLSIEPWGLLITQGLKVVMDYINLFHTVCICSKASIQLQLLTMDAGTFLQKISSDTLLPGVSPPHGQVLFTCWITTWYTNISFSRFDNSHHWYCINYALFQIHIAAKNLKEFVNKCHCLLIKLKCSLHKKTLHCHTHAGARVSARPASGWR